MKEKKRIAEMGKRERGNGIKADREREREKEKKRERKEVRERYQDSDNGRDVRNGKR